jgi:O-antigen/teichoic acid export membrane protein
MTDLEPILVPEVGPGLQSASLTDRLLRWVHLLRVHPYDVSTPEGRSAERYRRIAWSTLLSTVARFVGLATSFISVPLVVTYLGKEPYGMWLTMSSLVAALGPLDLGIGLGLLTVVSDAYGRDDREAARKAISNAFAMLTSIAFIASLVFAVVYFLIPWARVFNVTDPTAVSEAGPASAVLFGSFVLGLPLGIIGQVQLAYQSGYISSAWAIVGNICSFLALLLIIVLHGSLPVLLIGLTCVGLITAALNGWLFFGRHRRWLLPRLSDIDFRAGRGLLKTGSFFIVLQLTGLAAYQLDNFVIAQIMGAGAVIEYSIPSKLFSLAPSLLSFVMMPLWPAYRESMARGDGAWVRRTLRRSLVLAAMVNVPSSLILFVAAPLILQLWVGSAVHPTTLLLFGLAAWTVLNTINGPFAMLLNGANVIGFQAVCSILMAIANVTISVLLVQHIGVSGAVYGSVIAQCIFIIGPETWYIRRLLRRLPT